MRNFVVWVWRHRTWNVLAVALAWIGVSGVPGDLVTWSEWYEQAARYINHDAGRWALVIVGVAIVIIANVPWARFRIKTPTERIHALEEITTRHESQLSSLVQFQLADKRAKFHSWITLQLVGPIDTKEKAVEWRNEVVSFLEVACPKHVTKFQESAAHVGHVDLSTTEGVHTFVEAHRQTLKNIGDSVAADVDF